MKNFNKDKSSSHSKKDSKNKKTNCKNKEKKEKSAEEENSENKMMTFLTSQKAASMEVVQVVQAFRTDINTGLSSDECKRRKKAYGPNDFDVNEDVPLWKKYLNQVCQS